MESLSWLILAFGGGISGILAGLLGIGGGFIIVSLLVALAYSPIQAVATSSLVIILSSSAGSFYNWRRGYLDLKRVLYIAIPAILTAQWGVYFATKIPPYVILIIFGCFLLVNMLLIRLRKHLVAQDKHQSTSFNPIVAKIATGSIAGFLAGLLGVGGGAIMVPLQMLLLNEDIKVAIRTSLGVIVAATVSSCVVHASQGNVLFVQGLILGTAGMLGTQVGTRVLPKLPDSLISQIFSLFLATMAIVNFWQAWKSYISTSVFE
ncbi:sulfite exporter TauE/SafE family protein [Waterburya agarophytonicola K14]|uniref:Probable membrane transporter protein n=1 Tax=Waterburya agarophytonicola KI4 TaxID=2874699 RepID=A0A964BQL7_9CYAN|nr:sulfite exporter TauE/SafE family protein [Waterburya agarophytonicola]MCC0177784.1 sulfite exporter TauE/SafE family protein [Waterburya agarophytonicola KI4]